MFDISQNNLILVTRGDSFSVPLFINKGTDLKPMRYTISDKDEIYLAIMEPNQPFEYAVIKKVFTSKDLNKYGDVYIDIDHEDTCNLIPGKYFYQIKGRLWDYDREKYIVNTLIDKTEFRIKE